jgi:mycothiol synthase
VQAVAELIAACQLADGDKPEMTREELLSDWEGINLATEAVAVTDRSGGIVAYADLLNRRYVQVSVYGYVQPAYRGRGLGSYLVRWGAAWARDHMHYAPKGVEVIVEHYLRQSNESGRRLMEAHGYALARVIYVMAIELDQAPPSPQWPEGIAVRTFVPGQDERAVYEAGEDAFQDSWSRPPGTLESWMAPTRAKDFDSTLWFLAEGEATGEIAGLCRCQVVVGRGWIATLGVRRSWRNRGVGLAILQHAFGEYYRRGVREVELSVDAESPTGAPRLYIRAGMEVTKSYLVYGKELRPGAKFSSLSASA